MAGRTQNLSSRIPGRSIPVNDIMDKLCRLLEERRDGDPSSSYVASLHAAGLNKILEKVGEETTETIIAAKDAATSGDLAELVQERQC